MNSSNDDVPPLVRAANGPRRRGLGYTLLSTDLPALAAVLAGRYVSATANSVTPTVIGVFVGFTWLYWQHIRIVRVPEIDRELQMITRRLVLTLACLLLSYVALGAATFGFWQWLVDVYAGYQAPMWVTFSVLAIALCFTLLLLANRLRQGPAS